MGKRWILVLVGACLILFTLHVSDNQWNSFRSFRYVNDLSLPSTEGVNVTILLWTTLYGKNLLRNF